MAITATHNDMASQVNPNRIGGVLLNSSKIYFLNVDPEALVLKLDEWLCDICDNCRKLSAEHSRHGDLDAVEYWDRKVAEIELFLLDRKFLSSIEQVSRRQSLLSDACVSRANVRAYIDELIAQYSVDLSSVKIDWVMSAENEIKLAMRTSTRKSLKLSVDAHDLGHFQLTKIKALLRSKCSPSAICSVLGWGI